MGWFWTKQTYNNNISGRFSKPLLHRMDEVGRDRTQQIPLWVILITEEWTILTEWAWKRRNPEEKHFEGLIGPGRTSLEVGEERNESVVTWKCLAKMTAAMLVSLRNGWKMGGRRPHTQSLGWELKWLQKPGRCKGGGRQAVGAASLRGVCHSWASAVHAMQYCHFRVTRSPIFAREVRNSDLLSEIS